MAAALAFFASRADTGQFAYISAPVPGKRDNFDRRIDPFGAPPAEDDPPGARVRGF